MNPINRFLAVMAFSAAFLAAVMAGFLVFLRA